MSLPTPYTLGIQSREVSGIDERGNFIETWADPRPWPVSGIAPATTDETHQQRDGVRIDLEVYAPATQTVPGELDRVIVLDGPYAGEYAVEGRPEDWTQGPWPSTSYAGVKVGLRRTEG